MNNLIDIKTLNKKAEEEIDLTKHNLIKRREVLNNWIRNLEYGTLDASSEIKLQGEFIKEIFSFVLNCVDLTSGFEKWNLEREEATNVDSTKADGILGYFTKDIKDVRAVIELKKANTNLDISQNRKADKRTPVEQAFAYAPKYGKNCKWVIVSNYKEIRLYRSNEMSEYHVFYLKDLKNDLEFKKFIYMLSFNALMGIGNKKSKIEELSEEYQKTQKEIQKNFYNEYKNIRIEIFNNVKKNNKNIDELIILEKVQKLLDRFLFICFCEDKELLPKNIYHDIVEKGKSINDTYQTFKNLCSWIDKGSSKYGINKYNGGLFKEDEILDDLIIDDEVFLKLEKITNYDFESELNENILGHIFEQSISDLEELKNEIFNKKESKRKKDGIFYTPKYITKYMVKTSIESFIEDVKKELGEEKLPILTEKDSKMNPLKGIYTVNYKKHIEFWEKLRERVRNIKIIDPACGSGAFLITAFEFLKGYNEYLNNKIDDLKGVKNLFNDIDTDILKNNLYGVDINNESVEITKLSLWLKTANKEKQLVSLDNNIKCGNSLIDDPNITDKPFNWKEEFKEVFERGGFDVVIGNPPYGVNFNELEKEYLEKFDKLVPDYEIYIYFISLYKKILKKYSYLTYIFPNTFLSNLFSIKYKNRLFKDTEIIEIVNLTNDKTFEEAGVKTIIFTLKNNEKKEYFTKFSIIESKKINKYTIYNKKYLLDNIDNILNLFYQNEFERKIIEKVLNTSKLNDFFSVSQGLIPYDKYRGHSEDIIKNRAYHSNYKKDDTYKPELKGGNVVSYYYKWNEELWISYGKWLAAPREEKFFRFPRVLIREITTEKLQTCYIEEEFYNTPSLINVINEKGILDLKYLLCILNSKLIGWLHNKNSPKANKGLFPKILINDVRNIPIKQIPLENQKSFIEKADLMLELHNNFNNLKDKFIRNIQREFNLEKFSKKLNDWYLLSYREFLKEIEKNKVKISLNKKEEWEEYFNDKKEKIIEIKNDIEIVDKKIDDMVYKLYGLTDSEISIIENSK